jgi:exosortase
VKQDHPNSTRRFPDAPGNFIAVLGLGLAFITFLVFDQSHWWRLNPDYAFGWLVPIFAVYLVIDRLPKLQVIFRANQPHPLPLWLRCTVSIVAGLTLGMGLILFLLGAICRAVAGVTQPGSFALAAGFAGVLLSIVYFNTPNGRLDETMPSGILGSLQADARLRAAGLFLFPALIWILSAPLASAIESAVSLFLLHKVVAVVFAVFDFLGCSLVQEGNVLVLPLGRVGVADACSGIRSLTGCLFAGSFLAAMFLDRFWKKVTLVCVALGLAFVMNLLRSLFLTAWAYAYGVEAMEGTLHDITGYAVLGLTCAVLFGLLPLFRLANWRRWLGAGISPDAGSGAV